MLSFSQQIFNLSKHKASIILLCSSGVDSIAASYYFLNKVSRSNVSLIHFNHNLREQNNKMEHSFKNFAETLNVPYNVISLRCYDSTENACREARLKHLASYKDTTFITAHHLNDCVESYLLNCIRGKEGFLPIPFNTETKPSNCINRPFIFNSKKDFTNYAKHNNLLEYVVEDETNLKTKGSRRNMLRNQIIPVFEKERVGLDTIVAKKMLERLNRFQQECSEKMVTKVF